MLFLEMSLRGTNALAFVTVCDSMPGFQAPISAEFSEASGTISHATIAFVDASLVGPL